MQIQFSKEAYESATLLQFSAISRLAENNHQGTVTKAEVFDLPDGHLTFRMDHKDGGSIYGGIAPDGEVST